MIVLVEFLGISLSFIEILLNKNWVLDLKLEFEVLLRDNVMVWLFLSIFVLLFFYIMLIFFLKLFVKIKVEYDRIDKFIKIGE